MVVPGAGGVCRGRTALLLCCPLLWSVLFLPPSFLPFPRSFSHVLIALSSSEGPPGPGGCWPPRSSVGGSRALPAVAGSRNSGKGTRTQSLVTLVLVVPGQTHNLCSLISAPTTPHTTGHTVTALSILSIWFALLASVSPVLSTPS